MMKFHKELVENLYYHCLHYVINKKIYRIERLFWLIWLILSMIGGIYVVNFSVITLFTPKSGIKVRTDYLNFETPFPAIFICETFPMNKKFSQLYETLNFTLTNNQSKTDLSVFLREIAFINILEIAKISLPSDKKCIKKSIENEYCKFLAMYNNNLSLISNSLSASCKDIFTSCMFNGKSFNCCDYFFKVDSYKGPCFGLNSLEAVIQNENYFRHIDPDVKFNIKEKIPFNLGHISENDNNSGNLSIELADAQVSVWFMGSTNLPSESFKTKNSYERIPKQHILDIYLHTDKIESDHSYENLDFSKRNCRFSTENDNLKSFRLYSNSACETDCLRDIQLKFCNCIPHVMPKNQKGLKDEICSLPILIDCILKNSTTILKHLSNKCTCLNSCVYYDTISLGTVLSLNNGTFRNNASTSRVNFYTNAPTVKYVLYVYQEPLDFIVSVGGAISLFTGSSFLTLAQIFYYFIVKRLGERYLIKAKNVRLEEII